MRSIFDDLKDLIDYVESVYAEITEEWDRSNCVKVNLKKHVSLILILIVQSIEAFRSMSNY